MEPWLRQNNAVWAGNKLTSSCQAAHRMWLQLTASGNKLHAGDGRLLILMSYCCSQSNTTNTSCDAVLLPSWSSDRPACAGTSCAKHQLPCHAAYMPDNKQGGLLLPACGSTNAYCVFGKHTANSHEALCI